MPGRTHPKPVARPWLVGEAPSRTGDRYWRWPLSGRPAQVLCGQAGIAAKTEVGSHYGQWTFALYAEFRCVNLFRHYADAEPWSAPRARDRAGRILPEETGVLVVLGKRVLRAVVPGADEFYRWYPSRSIHPRLVACIPHPSGLNRMLNEPREHEKAGEVLRAAMRLAVTPEAERVLPAPLY